MITLIALIKCAKDRNKKSPSKHRDHFGTTCRQRRTKNYEKCYSFQIETQLLHLLLDSTLSIKSRKNLHK